MTTASNQSGKVWWRGACAGRLSREEVTRSGKIVFRLPELLFVGLAYVLETDNATERSIIWPARHVILILIGALIWW